MTHEDRTALDLYWDSLASVLGHFGTREAPSKAAEALHAAIETERILSTETERDRILALILAEGEGDTARLVDRIRKGEP